MAQFKHKGLEQWTLIPHKRKMGGTLKRLRWGRRSKKSKRSSWF